MEDEGEFIQPKKKVIDFDDEDTTAPNPPVKGQAQDAASFDDEEGWPEPKTTPEPKPNSCHKEGGNLCSCVLVIVVL